MCPLGNYIELRGKFKVKTRPGAIKTAITSRSRKEVTTVVNAVIAGVRSNCPVRTGALRRSHKTTRTVTATSVSALIYSDLDYAPIVHNGGGRRRANPWLTRSARAAAYARRWNFNSGV